MRTTVGILAHVDAGKTTFSEQLLLALGALRSAGRVDHGDTLLDYHPLERERGITVFSDQAVISSGGDVLYWVDTPGHPDFVSEAERAMLAMDYAVLIVSCAEGVQSHTLTLWELLKKRNIPVFLFLNKTDLTAADPDRTLAELRSRLDPAMLDLRHFQPEAPDEALQEEIASRDDALLEAWLSGEADAGAWLPALRREIRQRQAFPVFAGSALKNEGIREFAHLLLTLTETDYEAGQTKPLQAVCYRVLHEDGQRLCCLKLLSGSLAPKQELPGTGEKVNAIYALHGAKRLPLSAAAAGDLIALPGFAALRPGDRIGGERDEPRATPMLESDVLFDEKAVPAFRVLEKLRILEDEDPTLSVQARGSRLFLRAAGKLQLEVIRRLAQDRFGLALSFGPARVLYKETVAAPVIGIGHYEPLRHYAEVHLRLLPGAPGSGIHFESLASVNDLTLNWQRLIETHIFEREHKGVLTGAPLTDVTVQLLCGRAHLKHTEGGDFRQAVGRAVRNALMQAQSVLLEPVCRFEIRIPEDQQGRVTASLSRLQAVLDPPEILSGSIRLSGEIPLARFIPWQEDFPALTRGLGSLSLTLSRYAPCDPAEQERVVAEAAYDPLADDTPDSVFCAHGAGYTVAWYKVREFAHLSAEDYPV